MTILPGARTDFGSGASSGSRSSIPRLTRARTLFLKTILPLGLLFVLSTFLLTRLSPESFPSPQHEGSSQKAISKPRLEALTPPSPKQNAGGPRRLRLFMPADGPHVNLCKTVMSAIALGYPPPTILNWNGEFNRPEWHFAGSHIAKLESLLAVLDALHEDEDDADVSDEDLVLLVDAYDVWFQLPPSVLIERFHRLNREADARVAKQWEAEHTSQPDGFPIPPPKQNILVTTAKDCQPGAESGSDPHYSYWPPSPLPPDFYGPETDQIPSYGLDSARKYQKVRPRCVNSGMVMGTLGSLRSALRRCREKVDAVAARGRQLWSDQALLAEVIGDQEIFRHWARGLASTWNGTASLDDSNNAPREVRSIADAALSGAQFDFGIGLDYDFATIPPTCSSEDDGFFVQLNDAPAVKAASERAGVPGDVRAKGIPPELEDAEPPAPGLGWGNASLYTNFFFGTAPVGIHHNAYVNGLKKFRLEQWWNMTWYYPHLRSLVTSALRSESKLTPLARLSQEGDGSEDVVYWASKEGGDEKRAVVFDGSAEEDKFRPISWDGICQKGQREWHDVIFGDGQGPLQV
ncbi:hypothetical protein CSOJ01_03484 [Colletotrichum sojae]|uniref:Uncharacterized protein n=1 Tax=Colletotrichum sojae TaxID=2175907 RepID=A0A8H6N0A2_9PEZI|nr:hypothetical protein CSOJ01_03484 [Colletotrichum sojae]